MQVFVKPLSGAGEAVQLTDVTANLALTQWSPDGKYLVLSQREKGQWDLLTIPADKRSSPEIFLATEFNEMAGKISPDGNWMAYSSDETGTMEIYVRPFPKGAGVWRISTEGGEMPVWSSNGRELFYRTKEGISSVSVSSVSGAFKAGTPQLLFKVPIPNQVAATRAIYDVTSDGKQFLVPVNLYADTAPPVTVITNWSPAKP
jgi:Tol biopolymer transport system component